MRSLDKTQTISKSWWWNHPASADQVFTFSTDVIAIKNITQTGNMTLKSIAINGKDVSITFATPASGTWSTEVTVEAFVN